MSSSSADEIALRGAVVHHHDLVHVGERGPDDLDGAVRREHRHDRAHARGQRARRRARGRRVTVSGGERHQRGEREGAEPEHRAVAAGELDGHARQRQGGRRRDRAAGEEDAAVAACLAVRHEAGEVREAECGHEPGAQRGGGEGQRGGGEAGGGRGGEEAGPEQRGAREEDGVDALGRRAAREHDPDRRDGAEGERERASSPDPEAEGVLGVQDEEGGQGRVAEHPHRLGEQDVARTRPADQLAQARGALLPGGRGSLRRALAEPQPPDDDRGGDRGEREHDGRERERRGGRRLDQSAADRDCDHGSDEAGHLLRARGGRPAAVLDVVGDDRAVRRGERVEAGVDDARSEAERDVRARVAEPHGHEAAGRHDRPARDEGQAPAAPVGPDADGDRHGEAGDGVDHHHDADQRGRVVDALEQHRQVGRGECASCARADGRHREAEQRACPPHAAAPASGAATRRRAGSMVTVAVVVPSGTASATTGSGFVSSTRVVASRVTPRRPMCRPLRAAARSRRRRVRPRASSMIASKRPSVGSAPGATSKPNPKKGRFEKKSCAAELERSGAAAHAERGAVGAVAPDRADERLDALLRSAELSAL